MPIKNRLLLSAATLAAATLVTNHASADRRTSLQSNELIEDRDDVFRYPHLAARFGDTISMDYGSTGVLSIFDPETGDALVGPEVQVPGGNALFLLDAGSSTWGLAIHRGDLLAPDLSSGLYNTLTATGSAALGSGDFSGLRGQEFGALSGINSSALVDPPGAAPQTMVDLLASFGNLGFRLGVGHGSSLQSQAGASVDTEASETFVLTQLGYGLGQPGDDFRMDISANALLQIESRSNPAFIDPSLPDNTLEFDSGRQRVALDGRAFVRMNPKLDLGLLGNVNFAQRTFSSELAGPNVPDSDPSEEKYNSLAFTLGAGPAIQLDKATIAGYATVGGAFTNGDPDTDLEDDEGAAQVFLIPGAKMSFEAQLSDWFAVRTGASYQWLKVMASQQQGMDDEDTSSGTKGSFDWSAGFGVVLDRFRFDGTLQNSFLTSGPDFVGGNAGGFLAMASMSYDFSDRPSDVEEAIFSPEPAPASVRSTVTPQTPSSAARAPAPAAVVAPALSEPAPVEDAQPSASDEAAGAEGAAPAAPAEPAGEPEGSL